MYSRQSKDKLGSSYSLKKS